MNAHAALTRVAPEATAPAARAQQRCGDGACAERARQDRIRSVASDRGWGAPPPAVPPVVGEVVRSAGQPLDAAMRAFFAPRFGHDFGRVRVHNDARAAASTRAIDAVAYTVGSHIVLDPGRVAPDTRSGRHVLAHELAHVSQQRSGDGEIAPLRLGPTDDAAEREARAVAATLTPLPRPKGGKAARPSSQARDWGEGLRWKSVLAESVPSGTIQRFSTAEHTAIGDAAYERARPQDQSAAGTGSAPAIDPAFVQKLRTFEYRRPSGATMTYGQLVAAADNIASLALLEAQDRERQGAAGQIPVLSHIWRWIGDKTHYLDLASRNLKHFHPHNFMAWQAWQWKALHTMSEARTLIGEANAATGAMKAALERFDVHRERARAAIAELDALGEGAPPREAELERAVDAETGQMARAVEQAGEQRQVADTKRQAATDRALRAVTINGFGNHFLTDAFAAGHIVTPREDLLRDYSTRLLGVIPTGGVLNCANIPSLAWHDLDNRFGVLVNNRNNQQWLTYGDDYADTDALPGGRSLSPTKEHVVEATAESLRQLWAAASGPMPASLAPVLDQLPRPVLDKYPRWTPEQWDVQLRYAAGEPIGADYRDALPTSQNATPAPREDVPNPKGNQIGEGLLSARATCLNLLPVFSYQKFVAPMLARIRQEYAQRFYVGSSAQTVSPETAPAPQESVVGHVVAGSLIGGLGGALLGFAFGGPLGAVIGGIAGLLGGGFIGGLLGRQRKSDEAAV